MQQPKHYTYLPLQSASATRLGCLALLAILVAISTAMILLSAWQKDFTIPKQVVNDTCTVTPTPTTDLLPWAVCHVQKKTVNSQFVYGFGHQDITYPHADPAGGSDKVLKVFYPKNSINPKSGRIGGVGFYTSNVPLADEGYVEYEVYFPEEFKWVKGGKLPGIYGGGKLECSGGDKAFDCFSVRLMWRASSIGETYLYVPRAEQHPSLFQYPPRTIADPTYGISLGRGGFKFLNEWNKVGIYVRLNTVGKQDGLLMVWINSLLVVEFEKMVYRTLDEVQVTGIMFDTFFGGSKPGFEAAEDSVTYFRNMHLAETIPERLR